MKAPLHILTAASVVLTLTLSSSLRGTAASRPQPNVSAQPNVQMPSFQMAMRYVPPRPAGNGSRPGTRRGAASRGCLMLAKVTRDAELDNLIAIVPESQTQDTTLTQVWGQTSAAHPTLWFYNPYRGESIQSIEFVLQDEQDQDVSRIAIAVPKTAGIMSVTLPTSVTLQPGAAYHWYLKIYGKDATQCGKSETSAPDPLTAAPDPSAMVITPMVYVDGWIVRRPLEPAAASQIKQLPAQQQAALYAEQGFWYDAVTALAQAKQQGGNAAVVDDWRALLKQVGLEKLATQPVVKCCSVTQARQPQ